jgi:MerR family mercuric resistance operon transcriptional regulator
MGRRQAVLEYGTLATEMSASRTIGRLAEHVGVNVETIRFYQRRGLIKQPRKPAAGARHYDDETLRIVRFIKQAQSLGFSLDEIQELLSLRRSTSPAVCSRVHSKATAKIEQIEQKIDALQRMHDVLVELIEVCPQESAERCSILRALDVGRAGPGAEGSS